MDIRVIGGGAAAAAFAVGGFNYVSMEDVLSHELRHVSTISAGELQGYMDSVAQEFADTYGFYEFEGDDYVFVADIRFTAEAATRTFGEVVESEDTLSTEDRKQIGADISEADYCSTSDAIMFTSKGYNYTVTVKDGSGALVNFERCKAEQQPSQLRPGPSA